MSVEEHADLSREQIRCLDQFIFRFSKLQDTMGAKLFRQVLAYLEEDVTTLPMIDILRLMERYGFIDHADEWATVRELRNEIAHDYPLLENDAVAAINELISQFDTLRDIYGRLREAVKGRWEGLKFQLFSFWITAILGWKSVFGLKRKTSFHNCRKQKRPNPSPNYHKTISGDQQDRPPLILLSGPLLEVLREPVEGIDRFPIATQIPRAGYLDRTHG